ncbi:MAG: DUF2220 family protein [Bacillota bacterium]|nr:DUF2220 family protein [Bacillota bacterium]MDW7676758.1 DUF2220 family protein [Bacillota bacterium]
MSRSYEISILEALLDKYERSKSFTGDNKVQRRILLKVTALFPDYADHANYDVFRQVNEAVDFLVCKGWVAAKRSRANLYGTLYLNVAVLAEVYAYCQRTPKRDIHSMLVQLLEKYQDRNEVLHEYCREQRERIRSNKPVQFFNQDLVEFEKILIAADEVMKVEQETFVRDFSVRLFNDSKAFEKISGKVINLLYEYGDFPEKDQILGNLNLVKNPAYVNFKGAGKITIKGQTIDLAALSHDIAVSSAMLPDIERVQISGNRVLSIENLTSFHTFNEQGVFVLYLGGYHNAIRRQFLKKIREQNPAVEYFHFGDIDAGGFYILKHLRERTGIHIQPYKMDVETLKQYQAYTKKLTANDRSRLMKLLESEFSEVGEVGEVGGIGEVIRYMLENDCKLEQEAVGVR